MKYCLILKALFSFFLIHNGFLFAETINRLQKIDYHISNAVSNDLEMGLGTIALFFESDPIMNILPTRKEEKDNGLLTFFFPMADIVHNQEYKTLMTQLNKQSDGLFSLQLDLVKKPVKGIKLTIRYDKEMILVQYESLESKDFKHGVIFKFYNEVLRKKVESYRRSILSTAGQLRYASVQCDYCII